MEIFGVLALLPWAYFFGQYHERSAWNELIKSGVLPKPKGVRK